MSEDVHEVLIKRILVALDASSHSLAALEAAADLAAHLEAELVGLFVEDVNLLRLGELPFAREVGVFSARWRRVDTREIERQLRAQAERARRALEAQAHRTSVRWSFEVRRGVVGASLLQAASDADLVIMGRAGHSTPMPRGLGTTARGLISGLSCPALVVAYGSRLRLPVLVLHDGSELAWKALSVAVRLVEEQDRHLVVLVAGDTQRACAELRKQVGVWLREREVMPRYRLLLRPGWSVMAEAIQQEGCGTLVVPASIGADDPEGLLSLLDELELPTLLVR
jgi:nucleotide-binding universal stress UspA family protein